MDLHRKELPENKSGEPFEMAYAELRALAERHMAGERANHTLQPTALIHEAFIRLGDRYQWENRNHFMAVASRAMRQVLLDHARRRSALKRNGQIVDIPIGEIPQTGKLMADEFVALNEALGRLDARNQRQARLIELVYFGGMTLTKAAEHLSIARRQAQRDWAFARLFLQKELSDA